MGGIEVFMKRKLTNEDEIILEGILKKCSWYERIIVKRNRKLISNIYHYTRLEITNAIIYK